MVDDHPSPEVPFFLNYCSHIVHSPLQAPAPIYHSFDFMVNDYDKHRQIYGVFPLPFHSLPAAFSLPSHCLPTAFSLLFHSLSLTFHYLS